MTTIKAIETRYAGCRFRSRLEARWAVFYERMGIKWEYEPQGFLIDGQPYLPDFWLPEHETWIEIKGAEADLGYGDLLAKFAEAADKPIVMFTGPIPAPGSFNGHKRGAEPCTGEVFYPDGWDNDQRWWICWRCGKPYIAFGFSDGHMRCRDRGCRERKTHLDDIGHDLWPALDDAHAYLYHCLEIARSARFEHGENG